MDCPDCGLVNPETAQRGDCGYGFPGKLVKESYVALAANSKSRRVKPNGRLEGPWLIVEIHDNHRGQEIR
jgi:hypothetical protein